MIVALSGKARSGKDTCADILVSKFKFKKIALADPLREICSKVFDIPLETFLSDELKEKNFERPIIFNDDNLGYLESIIETEWGFKIDYLTHLALYHNLGAEFANPRQLLQQIGTEIIRGCVDDNIFLKLADKRIEALDCNVVVSDVRFKVEQEWAKNKGAMMCLIKRPNLVLKVDNHSSENQLGNEDNYAVIMYNSSELSDFKHDVHAYFSEIMSKRSN